MLPLRLVIDTNVLVSAAIKPAGLQRTVFLMPFLSQPACLRSSDAGFSACVLGTSRLWGAQSSTSVTNLALFIQWGTFLSFDATQASASLSPWKFWRIGVHFLFVRQPKISA